MNPPEKIQPNTMKRNAYIQLPSGFVLETDEPGIWPEAKRLSAAEGKRLLRAEAAATLRKVLAEGSEVWGLVLSVSASGMSRKARFYAIKGSQPLNITGDIARVLGWRHDGGDWVTLRGCGMDMLWHTVENIGSALGIAGLQSRRL